MAARKLNTPGAETQEQATTDETTTQDLDAVLGTTPTTTQADEQVTAEQFDAVAQELAETKAKLQALEKAQAKTTKAAVAVAEPVTESKDAVSGTGRFREKLTDAGWIREEY